MEQGAYFGSGRDFTVGSHVGLGKNFKSLNRIVTIDDYLMMGEDVLFLERGPSSSRDANGEVTSPSSAQEL